jgi:DNA recombination protein RmuC
MEEMILILLMALVLIVCVWLLMRKPSEADNVATPLQNLTQVIQTLAKDTAVLTEKVQKIDSDQARLSSVLQDVQNGVIGTNRDTQGLLKTTSEMRQHLDDAKIGLNTLHTITKERQEDERLMSESVRRLESVIAGTQSKGAAGENILDMVFSKLPADWQVRDFGVDGKVCEFGLRLPNKRIMPIDSKWAATNLLEKFMACEEISVKKKIKADIEKAVLRKAEEVRKYLDPETTCGFGVAVVPDAIYDLCGATLCQVFEMRVAIISYSMFVPYLLLVFQTNLKTSVDIDMHKLSHAISESEKSIKAIQDKLDGSFSRGITQLANSRDEVKREAANVSKLLNSIHMDKDEQQVNAPMAIGITVK